MEANVKQPLILAITAAALVMTGTTPSSATQSTSSRTGTPMPEGRRIEAQDGDLIVTDGDARVRFLRRRNAVVRIIFNATDRWAVMLADYVPTNGKADGYVDNTYNWRGIAGNWPIDERWEGTAVIEDYQSLGVGASGFGIVLPQGRIQFLNNGPTRNGGFEDPTALAVLNYRAGGTGGAARETFDQAEPRMIANIAANLQNGSFSSFSGPGGISGGVSFVTGSATGAAPTSVTGSLPEPNAPIRVGGSVAMPRKIHDVAPVYPEAMRQSGVGGVVILELVIGTDGSVTSAKVLRGQPGIDQAAIDAAKQWRYEPVLLNGVAVPVILTATVNVRP
jgi:TonB family protein